MDLELPTAPPPRSPWRRRAAVGVTLLLLVAAAAAGVPLARQFFDSSDPSDDEPRPRRAVLRVNTTTPQQRTLVRTLDQPGSIAPEAQVELYAKASGYLRALQRDVTPAVAASWACQPLLWSAMPGAPLAGLAARGAAGAAIALAQAPSVDIGSRVRAGDVLVEIDVPERQQDVIEREAALAQREEELALATAALDTFRAAIDLAKANKEQARADVKRYQSEYTFRMKELERIKGLVKQRALEERVQDEKQAQVGSALSAKESAEAKVQSAQAELMLATSKLKTAQVDVRVKAARVREARAELERSFVLLDYGRLYAPFDGLITFRSVDEGDFVQNSRTGSTKPLLTVTAVDRVKVVLQVPSREGAQVRIGAEAVLTVDSRPGERFTGRVSRTRGVLDIQSRTLQVEIDLDNRDRRLMPGMYGHVSLTLARVDNAWVVPAAALYNRKGVSYLLIVKDGIARRQPVRILFDDGHQMEVVKLIKGREVPLDGTEEVIISGKAEVADGQRVRPTQTTR